MRNRCPFRLGALMGLGALFTVANVQAVSLTRGPYIQMGHFTNRATIVWRTDVSADSWVDYGPTPGYGSTLGGASGYQHEVTLTGLQPGTTYYYRVRSAGVNLASAQFTSGKAPGMPFRIAVFSDAHWGGAGPVGSRMALYSPDLVLASGDITDEGTFEQLDSNLFSKFPAVLSRAALYWTAGNHDVADNYAVCREAFVLPPDELNYWFEYADAQIVSLNSEGLPGPAWLANALAGSAKPWKIVFFHQAAYSAAGGHGENAAIRDQYAPVMQQYGVQLAIAGHNHYYWRSVSISGITHVVTGRSGDRSRELGAMPCYSAAGVNGTLAKSFTVVDFDGPFMELRHEDEFGNKWDDMALDRECAFEMDGLLDPTAAQVAQRPGGRTLWAARSGRYLYLATQTAGDGRDAFLFLTTYAAGMTNAPWAKSGSVTTYDAFLADENDNNYNGWFAYHGGPLNDLRTARSVTRWCGEGVVEGVLDLEMFYGGYPDAVYLAAAAYATTNGGALIATTQCPAGNGDAHLDPSEFAVVYLADLVIPFVMDGRTDHNGYLIADNSGMKLWAAVYGSTLYVATWAAGDSGGPNDHFIFVTDTRSELRPAPWAKAGSVAVDPSVKPFLADESINNYAGWQNAGASARQAAAAVSSGQLEGTLNLVEAFGYVPDTLFIAVAPYATADGGALHAPSQVPAGNGDGHMDASEFLSVPLVVIRDENLDGHLDSLDSNRGFVLQRVRYDGGSSGAWVMEWPSVPGHTYQVEKANSLRDSFQNLSSNLVAGQGQFLMNYPDTTASNVSSRFYRLRLVDP